MSHLTQQHVLFSLQATWMDVLGIDEEEVSTAPEQNLVEWLKSLGNGIYEELDLADVHYRLCADFGLDASLDQFGGFLRSSVRDHEPTLTLGQLADWILEHAPIPSYAPVTILGTRCQPAGTFLGIQEVVRSVVGRTHFAPSTPVLVALKGRELAQVWRRLRLHSGGGLPQLSWPLERLGCGLTMAAIFVAGLSLIAFFERAAALGATGVVAAAILMALGVKLSWVGNPLPGSITTFKDLSNEMTRALSALKSESNQ